MANIKNELNNIKSALYGKDVRGSIHDGIDAINKEVESTTGRQVDLENTFDQLVINAGNSNAEIVDARVKNDGTSYSKLGDRLDAVDSQLAHIAKITTDNLQNDINEAIRNNQNLMIKNGILSIDQVRYEGTGIENININCNLNTLIISNYNSLDNKKGVLHFENLDTVKISNLKMEYTNRDETLFNYHNLLDIRNCKNVIIENCQFNNSLYAGFSIEGCENVVVRNTKASGNYYGGFKFSNSNYILIDGCNFSDNGWPEHQNKGYGIAQEISKIPCGQFIVTNSIFNNNVRKGIDCHEFYNATITNNELNGNGILGIALENNDYNSGKVIISNNIIENQSLSNYTSEGAIDVTTVSRATIEEIIISGNIIKNVCCRGIGIRANSCRNVLISNNIIKDVIPGGGTSSCLRLTKSTTPCDVVKIIGNTFSANETANIIIEQCNKLFVENNYLKNTDNAISLHFPNKLGDIDAIPYAVIQGNTFMFAGVYFELGWKFRGSIGAITNNRHVDYTFRNNTVTNSDNTTYQLWEQIRGIRTMYSANISPSTPQENDWVKGDKIYSIDTFTNDYLGKVCIESGMPGTWAYFGKIERV